MSTRGNLRQQLCAKHGAREMRRACLRVAASAKAGLQVMRAGNVYFIVPGSISVWCKKIVNNQSPHELGKQYFSR